jgi:CII-binding regulator of phage lambda lysogenization HflD
MYRDIIENYDKFSNSLKSNYPEIIVDVISVINQGIDTKGNKVLLVLINTINQGSSRQRVK